MQQLAHPLDVEGLPRVGGRRQRQSGPIGVQAESLRIISETKVPKQINALMDKLDERFRSYPGMRAFSSRGSIISSNDGGTRAVALNISGPELPGIYQTALDVYQRAGEVIGGARINSVPASLRLGQPLLEIRPKWERLAEMGFSAPDFGFAVSALTDGAFVDEFFLIGSVCGNRLVTKLRRRVVGGSAVHPAAVQPHNSWIAGRGADKRRKAVFSVRVVAVGNDRRRPCYR